MAMEYKKKQELNVLKLKWWLEKRKARKMWYIKNEGTNKKKQVKLGFEHFSFCFLRNMAKKKNKLTTK